MLEFVNTLRCLSNVFKINSILEDLFDNAAPTLIENHIRRKRAKLGCKMFGQASSKCNFVVEARCGNNGQCPLSNLLYDCVDVTSGTRCNYLVIPCAAAMAQGTPVNAKDQAFCLLHMTNRNEHCTACCRDGICEGSKSITYCGDK